MIKITLVSGKIRVEETSPNYLIGEDYGTDMAFLCDVNRSQRDENTSYKILGPNIGEVTITPDSTLDENDQAYTSASWESFYISQSNPYFTAVSGGYDWRAGNYECNFSGNSRFFWFPHDHSIKPISFLLQLMDPGFGDLHLAKRHWDANGFLLESNNNIPEGTSVLEWYMRFDQF